MPNTPKQEEIRQIECTMVYIIKARKRLVCLERVSVISTPQRKLAFEALTYDLTKMLEKLETLRKETIQKGGKES